MNRYHRDLQAGVRALGATHVTFEPGGKHSKLCFLHAGTYYRIPAASSPSDFRALTNSLRAIRRQLHIEEEPMQEEIKTKSAQEPEQLPLPEIPEIPDKPSNQCTIANYSNTMVFSFPPVISDQLSVSNKYDVTRVSKDSWEIKPGTQSSFTFNHRSKKGTVTPRIYRSANIIAPDMDHFNARPAHYEVIDGNIAIQLLGELPLKRHPTVAPRTRSIERPVAAQRTVPTKESIAATLISRLGISPTNDDLRALLAALRHIETTTQLRLTRDGDKLLFIARIE